MISLFHKGEVLKHTKTMENKKKRSEFKELGYIGNFKFDEYTDFHYSIIQITSEKGSVSNHLKISKVKKDSRGYLQDEKQIFIPVKAVYDFKESIPNVNSYFLD